MQNDFVLRDQISKKMESDIEKLFESGYNNQYQEVINSSDITKCDRRIIYSIIGVEKEFSLRKDMHQTHIANKWAEILSNIKSFKLVEKEFVVSDHNHNISSKIDIIGNVNSFPVVVMIREVSNEIFQSEKAKRKHVIEIMTQMWLAEINDGFLIYEENTTKRSCIFHILPNVSVLNSVRRKLITLRDCKMTGTLPERKYETPDSKECQECRFLDKCWRIFKNG